MATGNKTTTTRSRAKVQPSAPAPVDNSNLPLNLQVTRALSQQTKIAANYKNEKKVTVQISPHYQAYFGKSMHISLNGIPIYIPCDNKRYEIPESYAMEVAQRIRAADNHKTRGKRMEDYSNNFDGNSLGGLDLIKAL